MQAPLEEGKFEVNEEDPYTKQMTVTSDFLCYSSATLTNPNMMNLE